WAFGSPMVGDHEFASHWNELPEEVTSEDLRWSRARPHLKNVLLKLYRNGNDPVPLFPPPIRVKSPVARWRMRFRLIYIPVVLMRSVPIFVPHPHRLIAKQLGRLKLIEWFVRIIKRR